MAADGTVRPPGRAYALALLALAGGALLALIAYGMAWVQVEVPLANGTGGATHALALTGRELVPWAGAAGWVALAGVAGVIATRGTARRVVGLLVAIAGLATVAGCLVFAVNPSGLAGDAVVAQTGLAPALPIEQTLAWLLGLAGGIAVVISGAATVAKGPGWPVMGAKYERAAAAPSTRTVWELQDMGEDPTDDQDPRADLVE